MSHFNKVHLETAKRATRKPDLHFWAPRVWAFQNMAMYGDMPQTFDDIYHKVNAFLAGWYSVLERGGQPVRLDEVPEDWESPVKLPTQPDDETVDLLTKKFGK